MKFYSTPKPSNWLLVPGLIAIPLLLVLACWAACSSSQPQVVISDPTNLCASALTISREVQAQATKLGIAPDELAKQACSAAMLGVKLAEANLRNAGTAGAPPIVESGLAGAAGGP